MINALICPILRDCLQSVCSFLSLPTLSANFFMIALFLDHCLLLPFLILLLIVKGILVSGN